LHLYSKEQMNTTDWLGFIGVFQILLAYLLNVSGKLKTNDLPYILLNLVGAGAACCASILMEYLPFIILEGVWTVASLITFLKYISKRALD
jgi:hypothetical protein